MEQLFSCHHLRSPHSPPKAQNQSIDLQQRLERDEENLAGRDFLTEKGLGTEMVSDNLSKAQTLMSLLLKT
jgi:hypothetical protein